ARGEDLDTELLTNMVSLWSNAADHLESVPQRALVEVQDALEKAAMLLEAGTPLEQAVAKLAVAELKSMSDAASARQAQVGAFVGQSVHPSLLSTHRLRFCKAATVLRQQIQPVTGFTSDLRTHHSEIRDGFRYLPNTDSDPEGKRLMDALLRSGADPN